MRSLQSWGALLLPLASLFSLAPCSRTDSALVLPKGFTPPQVFKNTNLLRTIDITKHYVPVPKGIVESISYLEARGEDGPHTVNPTVLNPKRFVFWLVRIRDRFGC